MLGKAGSGAALHLFFDLLSSGELRTVLDGGGWTRNHGLIERLMGKAGFGHASDNDIDNEPYFLQNRHSRKKLNSYK